MTVEITDVADTPRRAIASFDPYEDAQALLDRLADGGFPVERLAIEGQDWRSSSASQAGSTPGAAFGLLFGLWFTTTACRWAPSPLLVRGGDARRGGLRVLHLRPERRTGSPGRQVSCQRPPPKLLLVAEAAVRLATEADRDQAVERLIKEAGDRECLEAASNLFVHRLHRRSDDFNATYGLKLVITAAPVKP